MATHNVQIIKIAFKSGRHILTALHGLQATQKPDCSGYVNMTWRNVTNEQFKTLKHFHPELEVLGSVNVAQVEAITTIDEL